ncbi:speckle-type POZ protein-like [Microplitis demolitor]|uniref:speckle-type POZ protein-like n=1 Tax=Microplitis demolitor TaxID=69319 RepID=UPI0004CD0FD4|nr:speckle-type POZ protein-like [Microplitis demolitor]
MPLKKIENNIHQTYDTWIIKNLSNAMANYLKTPVTREFLSELEGNIIKWRVVLENREKNSGEIQILFYAVNQTEVKKNVTCNFYIVDADENLIFIARKNKIIEDTFHTVCGRFFTKHSSFPIRKTDKTAPNDTLTLRIELITYLDDNPTFPFAWAGYHVAIEDNLPQTFLELYDEHRKDNGDINIQVKDIQFKVHRVVLERRCPLLYEDVARHQQTPEGTEFNIMDIDPDIFKRLLEFLYTGKINDLDDHSEYLLEAADRYKLKRLKQLCEKSLIDNYLTADNYIEVGDLAIRCHASQLKMNVLNFKNCALPWPEDVIVLNDTSVVTFHCGVPEWFWKSKKV